MFNFFSTNETNPHKAAALQKLSAQVSPDSLLSQIPDYVSVQRSSRNCRLFSHQQIKVQKRRKFSGSVTFEDSLAANFVFTQFSNKFDSVELGLSSQAQSLAFQRIGVSGPSFRVGLKQENDQLKATQQIFNQKYSAKCEQTLSETHFLNSMSLKQNLSGQLNYRLRTFKAELKSDLSQTLNTYLINQHIINHLILQMSLKAQMRLSNLIQLKNTANLYFKLNQHEIEGTDLPIKSIFNPQNLKSGFCTRILALGVFEVGKLLKIDFLKEFCVFGGAEVLGGVRGFVGAGTAGFQAVWGPGGWKVVYGLE